MANSEQLKALRRGSSFWNQWRVNTHPGILTEISGPYPFVAELSHASLIGENLCSADLSGADLRSAAFINANLSGANLTGADLSGADLTGTNLFATNMSYASLLNANLTGANLCNADLYAADLRYAKIVGSQLSGANMDSVVLAGTIFAGVDLKEVKSLESVRHVGPSEISIRTIYLSDGLIPETFLRGCEIPEVFSAYMRSLIVQPIQFYSCFISYSHDDEDFVRFLSRRMREMKLSVWCAIEDMKGGLTIHEQIYSAIQAYDKLLLVLSENSLQSKWVTTEIRRARKAERDGSRRKLFPIRLVDLDALNKWECFDADSGEDLALELRQYFIPDFSNWKDESAFEYAFDRLLRDLKAQTQADLALNNSQLV